MPSPLQKGKRTSISSNRRRPLPPTSGRLPTGAALSSGAGLTPTTTRRRPWPGEALGSVVAAAIRVFQFRDDEPVGERTGGQHRGGQNKGRCVGPGELDNEAADNWLDHASDIADRIIDANRQADGFRRSAALQEHHLIGR